MTMAFDIYRDGKRRDMAGCGFNQNGQSSRVAAKTLRADIQAD